MAKLCPFGSNLNCNSVCLMWSLTFDLGLMHLSVSSPRGGGGRETHGNLTVAYIPRVGILIGHHAFDLSILCSRREVNHLFLLIVTILFCPGVGILIIFF